MMNGQLSENIPMHETVTGSIVPNSWDQEFHITGVVIACESERELEVVNLTSYPQLSSLCRSRVRVTGFVMVHGDREQIQIENFRVLETDTGTTNQRWSKK